MATRTGAKEDATPGSILLAVHDFIARSNDELSLAKGDRLELIERDDEFGDGWFLGRHLGNARTGLFPEVYTTPAPKGTLMNTNHQRRTSEGQPRTPTSGDAPIHQRQASAGAIPARTASETDLQSTPIPPSYETTLRTPTSAPMIDPISTQSPVMNETLSVIDEHMNDMNTPPGSFTNGNKRDSIGSSSRYTSQAVGRLSYIAGHETDEEEHDLHTEEEVMAWTPERVAEYLEDHGVEKPHCEVFKEQEISGEVLLAMEQSSLFLKEFDLGSVGRRLKTWHKVRALQDEVRQLHRPEVPRSNSDYSSMTGDANGDTSRNRATTIGSAFPRALDTSRQSIGGAPGRSNTLQPTSQATSDSNGSNVVSPLQHMTSISRPENNVRPSAQSIRQMQHSRRHSSIDSDAGNRIRHRKQPSVDQTWQLGQAKSNGKPIGHSHTLSAESASAYPRPESELLHPSASNELDRGYFSSTEVDTRSKSSKKLTKRSSAAAVTPGAHSRNSSAGNRRSTLSGMGLPGGDTSPGVAQGIFGALNSVGNTFGSMRSITSPQLTRKPVASSETFTPVVTKLDVENNSTDALTTSPSMMEPSSTTTTTPSSNRLPFFSSRKPKITGLRTISDAVTNNEKQVASIPSPVKEGGLGSPARTGSTTPSTETRSFDMQKSSDVNSRTSNGSTTNLVPPPSQRRMRIKTKKSTSAYTRGLEKKPPVEAMVGCDYSGWMKKKSGSLMTTWKTRLFVLKGRRLSYYYADTDTEEKGLIDISFHRVLPAHNETLTGLHANITGAASPSSPKDSTTPTTAQQDLQQNPPALSEPNDGLFIFKLVPPKSGLSKGVNFTKPTVHYFAVGSRQEGRLWMAALMKATIDRDDDGMVTTTYNQKTITLAKARARRERPPALMESDTEDRAELDAAGDDSSGKGLGIGGLNEKDASTGAEKEDKSSVAPSRASTVATSARPSHDRAHEGAMLAGFVS